MNNPNTKRAQLLQLVSRKSGATMTALQKQHAWQPHSIRAEISRLRKGGVSVSCKTTAKGPVYTSHTPGGGL